MITIHFPRDADDLRHSFCDSLEADGIQFDLSPYGTIHEGHGKSPGVKATKVNIKETAVAVAILCGSFWHAVEAYIASSANRSIKIEISDKPTIEIHGSTDLERARLLLQQLQSTPPQAQTTSDSCEKTQATP